MTKKELIEALEPYPIESIVCVRGKQDYEEEGRYAWTEVSRVGPLQVNNIKPSPEEEWSPVKEQLIVISIS